MTSDDHNHDALLAALRSPATPEELAGEEAAVTAMYEVLHPVPARGGSRSRRGLTIAAVTVASLGVGGLVAAGPGFLFSPGGDDIDLSSDTGDTGRSSNTISTPRVTTDGPTGATGDESSGADPLDGPTDAPTSSQANAQPTGTAEGDGSNTGDYDSDDDTGNPADCADGNHGETVSEVARGTVPEGTSRGEVVSEVAQSTCDGDGGDDDAAGDDATEPSGDGSPGRSGEAPGQGGTNPGNGNADPGPPADHGPPADPGNGNGPPADPGNGRP